MSENLEIAKELYKEYRAILEHLNCALCFYVNFCFDKCPFYRKEDQFSLSDIRCSLGDKTWICLAPKEWLKNGIDRCCQGREVEIHDFYEEQCPNCRLFQLQRLKKNLHKKIWYRLKKRELIPEGYDLHHKDGNPFNFHPSNLQIVKREEHKRIRKNQSHALFAN